MLAVGPRLFQPIIRWAPKVPATSSPIVVDAMRHLWIGYPAGNYVWGAVVWSIVISAVFAPLAVRKYRRAAGG